MSARYARFPRCIAYDWQLPLLPAYSSLSSAQLLELSDDIVVLQSAQAIADLSRFNQATIKKVKEIAGADFPPYPGDASRRDRAALPDGARTTMPFYRGILGGHGLRVLLARQTVLHALRVT